MTDRFFEIDGHLRKVVFGPEAGIAERMGLVWHAAFVDEVDGAPLRSRVRITNKTGLDTAADRDGRAGLVGTPTEVYPDLPAAPVAITLTAEADGYLPRALSDVIAAHANHPAEFDPAGPTAPVAMQCLPTRLEGRLRRQGPTGLAPVAGATIALSGIWTTAPQGGIIPPVDPAEVIEIRPPLGAEVASGTIVRRVNLGAPGTDTTLAESAPAGATRIELAGRTGLAVGHMIALEPAHPDRFEIARISSIAPLPPAPLRGAVTLSQPLSFDHLQGIEVSRRTATAAAPARALTRDAIPGGASLFVDDTTGLLGSGFVRVGTGATAQIRRARGYQVLTDAGGFFRLPPIHRIARGFIDASDGISAVAGVEWVPRRDGPVDRLDLELPP